MKKSDNWAVQKIKSKGKFWIFVFALIFGSLFLLRLFYPFDTVDEEEHTISRNLRSAWFLPEQPDELPEMAWREDLPNFLKEDMERLLEDGWTLKYTYFNVEITMSRERSSYSDECYVYMYAKFKDRSDDRIDFFYVTDLSVYKMDNALSFYFWTDDKCFEQLVINKNFMSSDFLSRRAEDVPIGEYYEESWEVCQDYVLARNGQTFTLWKEGEEIFKTQFEYGEIEKVSDTYSIIATTERELYGVNIYIFRENSYMPMIDFQYIGKVDDVSPLYDTGLHNLHVEIPYNDIYQFPIFEKSGNYYACLPENFKAYASYSMANKGDANFYDESYDLTQRLVKLDESNFYSANIYYGYCPDIYWTNFSWVADIRFEDNGFYYTYEYAPILGYDRQYYLTDSEEEKLTKEVFSIADYWQAVTDIRAEYEKHYEKP